MAILFLVIQKMLVFPRIFDLWADYCEFSFLKSACFPRHSWQSGWNVPSFPRYLFTVLPKMLVFLGILDMVDGTWRVLLGNSVSRDSRNACFPMEFDVWAEFGEFSFLKSACFPRHSWHGGWNVPSFPRYLFTVLPKMLVFLGIFDMVDGVWRVSLGRSVRCDPRNACFPKDFSHSGWNWASLSWLRCLQCSQKCLFR